MKDWKWSTLVGLGSLIIIAFAISAQEKPDSSDSAFVAGYYTGRLVILIAGIWLIVKGLLKRRRGDDE